VTNSSTSTRWCSRRKRCDISRRRSVDHIFGAPGFSDAERAAMLGGTAAGLPGVRPG